MQRFTKYAFYLLGVVSLIAGYYQHLYWLGSAALGGLYYYLYHYKE